MNVVILPLPARLLKEAWILSIREFELFREPCEHRFLHAMHLKIQHAIAYGLYKFADCFIFSVIYYELELRKYRIRGVPHGNRTDEILPN